MKLSKLLMIGFLFTTLSFSAVSSLYAQQPVTKLDYSGFVKCDGVINANEPDRQRECDFVALVDTINKAINWLFLISIPVAAALFAYGGLLYLTGTSGNRTKANKVFTSVGKGFIIMLVAWLLVYTIVNWVIDPAFKSSATTFLEQPK